MLNIMYFNAKNWIIKIILSVIVLVFVFYGVTGFRSSKLDEIAVVNGEIINANEYNEELKNIVEDYKNRLKLEYISPELMNRLKKIVLMRLINHRLLIQQATKMGIYVSDQELVDYIKSNRMFFDQNVFSISRYKLILSNLGVSANQFEEQNKNFLYAKKMMDIVCNSIKISDFEILAYYNWYKLKAKFKYLFFSLNEKGIVDYNNCEIFSYFDTYENLYKFKPKYKLSYVLFTPERYVSKCKIGEAKIKEYFKIRFDLFISKKKVNISHILIKDNSYFEKEKLVLELLEKLNNGANFDELAELYSDCPSSNYGGNLGNIKYESLNKSIANLVFSMTLGEISKPVKSQFGWHIIKVNRVDDGLIKFPGELKRKIKNIIIKNEADILAHNEATSFLKNCFDNDSLIVSAKSLNCPFFITDWFSADDNIELYNGKYNIASIITSMHDDQIGGVHKIGDSYFIVQFYDKFKFKLPFTEEVKHDIISDFSLYKKRVETYVEAKFFSNFIMNKIGFFEDILEFNDIKIYNTNFINRDICLYNPSFKAQLFSSGFDVFLEEETIPKIFEGKRGFYILYLKNREECIPISSIEQTGDEKYRIADLLLKQKKDKTVSNLLKELKNDSCIIVKKYFENL